MILVISEKVAKSQDSVLIYNELGRYDFVIMSSNQQEDR